MTGIRHLALAPRFVLPGVAARQGGGLSGATNADFAALMKHQDLTLQSVNPPGSTVGPDASMQVSRRPDIEAALAQFRVSRRATPSLGSGLLRFPSKNQKVYQVPKDCDGASDRTRECTEEGGSHVVPCREQLQVQLAKDDVCGGREIDRAAMDCVPMVSTSTVAIPGLLVLWPSYPTAQSSMDLTRARLRRRRRGHRAENDRADHDGGDLDDGRT